MSLFTISQLSNYSGVKPHTIRAWEQRYQAFTPSRSAGNTRYYDDDQLRRLLNIVSLSAHGHKVSELCQMPEPELQRLLLHTKDQKNPFEYYISQLISNGMAYDEQAFETVFAEATSSMGLTDTYQHIVYPTLQRVGLMWAGNRIPSAKEHFVSNLLRRKLHAAIEGLPLPMAHGATWILFLPDNEYHETGLLLAEYLLRVNGQQVIYLGNNVSSESLHGVVTELNPKYLLLFLVAYADLARTQAYIDRLSQAFPQQMITVAGNQALIAGIRKPKNMMWLEDAPSLVTYVKQQENKPCRQ